MNVLHCAVRRLWLAVLVFVLAACSLTEPLPNAESSPQPQPDDAPVAAQNIGATPGGRLLYIDRGNVYVYQNGASEQLTDDGMTYSPAWSPDGNRIAVVRRDEESFSNIYLLNQDGENPRQVTDVERTSGPRTREAVHEVVWTDAPAWSSDGAELVYLSQVRPATTEVQNPPLFEHPMSIFQYPLDLLGERPPSTDDLLIEASGDDLQQPTWAPNDAFLAYVRAPRGGGPRQIMIYDPQTEQSQPYPGVPADAYDPVWSPDGRWLAFTTVVDGQTDVWVIDEPRRSGVPVRLTTSGAARAAAWSPNGRSLAFVQIDEQGANLYVMALEADENGAVRAGDVQQITTSGTVDANSQASWAE